MPQTPKVFPETRLFQIGIMYISKSPPNRASEGETGRLGFRSASALSPTIKNRLQRAAAESTFIRLN